MEGYSSPTKINMNQQGYGSVEYGSDSNMVVLFYTNGVKDEIASREQGTPVFKNVPYVRMHPAGEHLNVIVRPVQDADRQRFPRQWQQYAMNQTQVPDGTPLAILFPNNPALAETLKARGVHTIQQLAGLSSSAMDSIGMGSQEWVNKAKNYLKNAGGSVGFHELQKQITDRDSQIRTLQNQLDSQKRQIDDLISKMNNPNAHSLTPKFVPGFDAQSERINANHTTAELNKVQVAPDNGAMAVGKIPGHIEDISEHKLLQDSLGDVSDLPIDI